MAQSSIGAGRERRRRFVYVTRNTEYHTLDSVCVAIRDRRTGHWIERHSALKRRIEGGVRMYSNGCVLPTMDPPAIGDPMYFTLGSGDEDMQLVTSRVLEINRPDRADLKRYPARSA
jgi:hypothetical protein